jgi:hypothetical protein
VAIKMGVTEFLPLFFLRAALPGRRTARNRRRRRHTDKTERSANLNLSLVPVGIDPGKSFKSYGDSALNWAARYVLRSQQRVEDASHSSACWWSP